MRAADVTKKCRHRTGGALCIEMDFARTFPEKYHATTMVTTEFAPLI